MKYSADDFSKILKYEEKRDIKYTKTGGKLYKRILLFGFLSWLWMMFTQISYIIGKVITVTTSDDKPDNILVAIITASAVALLSIVFYAFRFKVSAFAINIVTAIVSAVSFISITKVSDSFDSPGTAISEFDQGYFGLKKLFYWRHGIPIVLVVVLSVWLIVITLREKSIIKKEFQIISKNEYHPQIIENDE